MAFSTTTNPDILYWDQAMKAPDRDKFIGAVRIELDGHEKIGNYEPVPLNEVPAGTRLLDMVRGSIVFLVYIDDCIIFGPDSPSIDVVVADL